MAKLKRTKVIHLQRILESIQETLASLREICICGHLGSEHLFGKKLEYASCERCPCKQFKSIVQE